MKRELFDLGHGTSKSERPSAIFEWLEAFYNPVRRHTSVGDLRPVGLEALQAVAQVAS